MVDGNFLKVLPSQGHDWALPDDLIVCRFSNDLSVVQSMRQLKFARFDTHGKQFE